MAWRFTAPMAIWCSSFLAPSANARTDEYGGSIENRARFAIEVAAAVAGEIGADRTAMRLSPGNTLGGIAEGAQGPDLYRYLVPELGKLGLVYLHLMHLGNEPLLADIRKLWPGALIVNRPGRPREQAGADVAAGLADLEAYGQMVLANPDFVERLKTGAAHEPGAAGHLLWRRGAGVHGLSGAVRKRLSVWR